MSSVNKVILVGNVGKDPEIRTMQSGDKIASFSVATSERWKDKATGEYKDKTEWHNVSVFNKSLVTLVESYVKKGTKVYVEGQLETRKYTDKHGVDKYATEVVLKQFRGEIALLGGREQQGQPSAHDTSFDAQRPHDDLNDEVPF
jgi:single-strand DNA-binding protein